MLRKLLVIGFALASLGFAQRNRGGDDAAASPMAVAPNKFETICNALNLTKEQKKTAKTTLDDAAKDATPLRDQMTKARIAIADAIQAKKSDDEIAQGVNAYAALAAQMSTLEINAFAKIYTGLDETQKANQNGVRIVFSMMKNLFATKNWNED